MRVFTEEKKLLGTLQVKASDQITSLYGALGRFLREHGLSLADISKIVLTGVGAPPFIEDRYLCNPQPSKQWNWMPSRAADWLWPVCMKHWSGKHRYRHRFCAGGRNTVSVI